jgi:hypothetical protein
MFGTQIVYVQKEKAATTYAMTAKQPALTGGQDAGKVVLERFTDG